MILKRLLCCIFILFFLLFAHTNAYALILGAEIFGLGFRFNNPGARANAMGGAFIGLADDATAAFTNPAGLTILTEPEICIEYKYGEYTNRVYNYDRDEDYDDTIFDTSFLSFAYPTEKATITLYQHRLVNIESEYTWREDSTHFDNLESDMDIVTTGLGMGLKLTDTFSLGLSIGFARLEYLMLNDKYDTTGSAWPDPQVLEIINDDDSAEHYTISILWNPFGEFNFGMVYRNGPEFKTTKSFWEYDTPGGSGYNLYWQEENTLKIPDVFGLGVSYRFFSNLTTALDVNYVRYSDILDDVKIAGPGMEGSDFEIDDTFEIHLGLEYAFALNDTPVALRCGYFFRPDHRIQYDGPDADFRQLLKDRDDHEHIFSLGFGAVLLENLQLDMAVCASEFITEGSLSIVYRF